MKKKTLPDKPKTEDEDMLPEYDFSGMKTVRGKHYNALQRGYIRRVHETNGTTTEYFIKPSETLVALAPDVHAYFPTSEAVNQALRALITVIEQTRHKDKPRAKRRAKPVAA